MPKAKFVNWKTSKEQSCEIKSKYSTDKFEPEYWLQPVNDKLSDKSVSLEEYKQLDVPESSNVRETYLEKLNCLKSEGKDKLPKNWEQLSIEKQCSYLDELLKELLEYDCDYSINVTLQALGEKAVAFVQFTNEDCTCDYEPKYVRCHLVRKDMNITLADLPKEFQEWAKDYYDEAEAYQETKAIELVTGGNSFSEALKALFNRIVLLFYGYDCLYLDDEYASYCEENDDDDDDDDDDFNFDFDYDFEDDEDDDEDDEDEDEKKENVKTQKQK